MVRIYPSVGLSGATDSTFKEFLKIFPECPHKPTVFFFFQHRYFSVMSLLTFVCYFCNLRVILYGFVVWVSPCKATLNLAKERKFKNNFSRLETIQLHTFHIMYIRIHLNFYHSTTRDCIP